MSSLWLRDVNIYRADRLRTPILRDVNLAVDDVRVLGVLGPNGSGKSSLLRVIAGLIPHDGMAGEEGRIHSGTIWLNGRDVTSVPPHERGLSLVWQQPQKSLFPKMTLLENILLPLQVKGVPLDEGREKLTPLLKALGLAPFADRLAGNASGGQQQRAAIARALAVEPSVLLLDEPFSSLDVAFRQEMIGFLPQHFSARPMLVVFVTHSESEAATLCDQITFVDDGRVHQTATPSRAYHSPATAFVARMFSGFREVVSGGMTVSGRFDAADGNGSLQLPIGAVPSCLRLALRPLSLRVTTQGTGIAGTVVKECFIDGDRAYLVAIRDSEVLTCRSVGQNLGPGEVVRLDWADGIRSGVIIDGEGRVAKAWTQGADSRLRSE